MAAPDPLGVFLAGFYAWLRELIRKAAPELFPPGEATSANVKVTVKPKQEPDQDG